MDTWYVLEDGSPGDPAEVSPDEAGVLRHKDGRAVAIGAHGNPRSRGMSADDIAAAREVKPEKPKGGYKTRESKAD